MMRDVSVLVCVDKHRVKVGEPFCPVAVAERGRHVIVQGRCAFQVAEHDFTRFSVTPSVVFQVNINILDLGMMEMFTCSTKIVPLNPLRQLDMLLSLCRSSEAKA